MPLLPADADRATLPMMTQGVITTIEKESAVLRLMPFMSVNGSALLIPQEDESSTVAWYAPNDPWDEDAPTIAQAMDTLTILGGNADTDSFLQQTYNMPNASLRALVTMNKAKATAQEYNNAFFNGDSVSVTNQFNGLKVRAGAPVVGSGNLTRTLRAFSIAAGGTTLTLNHMDQLRDAIRLGGPPDVFLCSKRSRRKLSELRRASGNLLETGVDAFGRRALFYDGIPLEIDENISDLETQGGNNDCSSIYAVRFGFKTGIMGIQNGIIQVQDVGALEDKDGWRTRIKWYCGLTIFQSYAYCRLAGVRD